jgi:hypothetical protein
MGKLPDSLQRAGHLVGHEKGKTYLYWAFRYGFEPPPIIDNVK